MVGVESAQMTPEQQAVARQYARWLEADAQARKLWDKAHREMRKLVRLAKLGRKSQIIAPISENRGVRIRDAWRCAMRSREDKVFTPAYARRHEVKEVPLESAD